MPRVDVTLGVKNAGFRTGMAQAGQAVENFDKRWQRIKRFGALGFTGLGAIRAISVLGDKYDRVGKLATRLRQSPEDIQRIDHIASQTGSSIELMAKGLTNANRVLGDLGNNRLAEAAAKNLGLEVKSFLALPIVERLAALADAYENSADKNRAFADLQNILGRSAQELVPALEAGGSAIRQMGDDISVVSGEGIRDIEAMNDAWDKLKTNFTSNLTKGVLTATGGLPTAGKAGTFEKLVMWWSGIDLTSVKSTASSPGNIAAQKRARGDRITAEGRNFGKGDFDDRLAAMEAAAAAYDEFAAAVEAAESAVAAADAPLAAQLSAARTELAAIRDGFADLDGEGREAAVKEINALVKEEHDLTKKIGAERAEAAEAAAKAASDQRADRIAEESERRASALDAARTARDTTLAGLDAIRGSVNFGNLTRIGGGFGSRVNLDAEANLTKDLSRTLASQTRTIDKLENAVVVLARATGNLDDIRVQIPAAKLRR